MRRFVVLFVTVLAGWLLVVQPASACGGLVAPNGAVQLQRTTTLAAYHGGVEHYVTAFEYAGGPSNFGSIIPLPGVPVDVRRAGSWTLQRLERETHPIPPRLFEEAKASAAASPAQVLLHTTVDALDINVVSGGGPAIIEWIKAHGYAVSADAPAMIDFYAQRSPVFLAARFDAAAAQARGQLIGDGTPIDITIPTPNPWVPLHILSLAKGALAPVQADVYLLTDRAPSLLGLDPGVRLQVSQPASTSLLADLRSDRDSGWIPTQAWLTFVTIDTTAAKLVHDLALDATGANLPSPVQAGYDPAGALPAPIPVGVHPVHTQGRRLLGTSNDGPIILLAVAVAAVLAAGTTTLVIGRRRALDRMG